MPIQLHDLSQTIVSHFFDSNRAEKYFVLFNTVISITLLLIIAKFIEQFIRELLLNILLDELKLFHKIEFL